MTPQEIKPLCFEYEKPGTVSVKWVDENMEVYAFSTFTFRADGAFKMKASVRQELEMTPKEVDKLNFDSYNFLKSRGVFGNGFNAVCSPVSIEKNNE
jgi:hypothetical protein